MTAQVLDMIYIEGRGHWLYQTASILPPGFAERIGLRFERESTANYRGWQAVWKIDQGRLFLEKLRAFGLLHTPGHEPSLPDSVPRDISHHEIFGTTDPVLADWISGDIKVAWGDSDFGARIGLGIMSSHLRIVSVEKGVLVSQRTIKNPAWNPAFSAKERLENERRIAIEAAEKHAASGKSG